MSHIMEVFGSMVFNDAVMKKRLPEEHYNAFRKIVNEGGELSPDTANSIAGAMKEWAIEHGATHFTHWFQPMTGITAEKHEAFIMPEGEGGVIIDFSGKELIRGESDASSFPSGGLRATFEARGYTAWDPTSYAFIKDRTLCIPTAYCSFTGEVLDKKTPLLRSMRAINTQSLRVLRAMGITDVNRVVPTVGPEQEYFLVDEQMLLKRPDLRYTGRTLLGARPVKGQELDDQYYGALKTRVSAFMRDLDEELWKLGVYARTEHNEVAPGQHELAPVFTNANTASDHNQITMELMQKTARKHGLACLLHEKPFDGVNGSGKHNNWSLSTDKGRNLLKPGSNPAQNLLFLLFFTAVIKAVDEHQDLLRISVSSAGNDLRLGGNEAPPAIISMFVGDDLESILDAVVNNSDFVLGESFMDTGIASIPKFRRDTTDRNRTSPFAFTGNKFEFRMPGSSFSIAGPNIVLNTIVADALEDVADELENSSNLEYTIQQIIQRTVREHRRIIFNGNNYSKEWAVEAGKRKLANFKNAISAFKRFGDEKNIALFEKHGIYTRSEIESRQEILLDEYAKEVRIEALTMSDMVRRSIFPAVSGFMGKLAKTKSALAVCGVPAVYETKTIESLSRLIQESEDAVDELDAAIRKMAGMPVEAAAEFAAECLRPIMSRLRTSIDECELYCDQKDWPFPTYSELLFSVT